MAFTGHTTWYTSSGKYGSVTAWAASVAYVVGDVRKQTGTPTAGNERCYVCILAGTSSGADPLTTFTRGVILTGAGGEKWQECTGIPAMNGDMTNTPNWTTGAKNTAITLGHVIQSGDGTKILIATVAGTAGNGAEPTWSNTPGGTTVDGGTLTWTTLKISSNHFSNWAAPHARIRNSTAATWGGTIGTKFFVGNTHASTEAATIAPFNALGLIATPNQYLCVNESGSVPPVTADLTTGASETATAGAIQLTGTFYAYGLLFDLQTASGNQDFTLGGASNNVDVYFDNCTLKYSGNNSSGSFSLDGAGLRGRRHFKDTTFVFGNAAQTIAYSEVGEFYNCTFAASGTVPTILFTASPGSVAVGSGSIYCQGCDMSAITTSIVKPNSGTVMTVVLDSCKLNAALSNMFDMSNQTGGSFKNKDIMVATRCGSDGKVNQFNSAYASGKVATEYTAVRTGGANDPGSSSPGFSLKMSPDSTNINPTTILAAGYLPTPFFGKYYNGSLNVSVTATIFGLVFAAALPTTFELFGEVYYLGTSSSPQTTRKTSRPAQLDAPTTLTADTTAWDSVAAARQNNHVYSLGDIIKTASTPGAIFQCTTGGTSAGSEPGGFTAAADGSSITDNTAVFRTCNRFKIAITLTSPNIQIAGNVTARLYTSKASAVYYIDPFLQLG